MKISAINNSIAPKNNTKKSNNNPSFKGVTNGLINFWQFVDNGGRALQFTVEDMTGTNIPRSIKGLLAGKKYSGHYNIPAFLQEAIREFLTGPTMCTVPWIVISLAKRLGGKSANIETNNLSNLSYLFDKNKEAIQAGQNIEDGFYRTVVKDMLDNSTGKDVAQATVDEMTGMFKQLAGSTDKKQEAKVLESIKDFFEVTVKSLKDDYKGTSFSTAIYTQNDAKQGACDIKNYAGYTTSYIKDFMKKYNGVVSSENIRDFKTTKIGYRLLTAFNMVVLTGILMCQIPKLYTKASGIINPNASAIYKEAEKNKQNNKTEAKN